MIANIAKIRGMMMVATSVNRQWQYTSNGSNRLHELRRSSLTAFSRNAKMSEMCMLTTVNEKLSDLLTDDIHSQPLSPFL